MRQAYRVIAGLVAVLVVVQAAAVAYGAFAIDKKIDNAKDHSGNVIMHASDRLDGGAGYGLHSVVGTMIIPVLAIALLIIAFFAHVPAGVKWAGFVFADVAVQIVLGLAAHSAAWVGWLHGPNALVLFALAGYTARRSATAQPAEAGAAAA